MNRFGKRASPVAPQDTPASQVSLDQVLPGLVRVPDCTLSELVQVQSNERDTLLRSTMVSDYHRELNCSFCFYLSIFSANLC